MPHLKLGWNVEIEFNKVSFKVNLFYCSDIVIKIVKSKQPFIIEFQRNVFIGTCFCFMIWKRKHESQSFSFAIVCKEKRRFNICAKFDLHLLNYFFNYIRKSWWWIWKYFCSIKIIDNFSRNQHRSDSAICWVNLQC